MKFDAEPPVVVKPADFARALDADPVARAAYDRLASSQPAACEADDAEG